MAPRQEPTPQEISRFRGEVEVTRVPFRGTAESNRRSNLFQMEEFKSEVPCYRYCLGMHRYAYTTRDQPFPA